MSNSIYEHFKEKIDEDMSTRNLAQGMVDGYNWIDRLYELSENKTKEEILEALSKQYAQVNTRSKMPLTQKHGYLMILTAYEDKLNEFNTDVPVSPHDCF